MTAFKILETILQQSDETLLNSLPTVPLLACQCCGSVIVAKRAHSEKTKMHYCPIYKTDKPVKEVTYFIKNKTTDPETAVARHREFWQKIYFEQLNRETGPATFLNLSNAAGEQFIVTADVSSYVESEVVNEAILRNSSLGFFKAIKHPMTYFL